MSSGDHHLYYSAEVQPALTMLRPNNLRSKSTYNISQPATSNKFGSRWTLAQTESSELLQKKQEDLHNTYYNNMVMYINNKNSDTDSTVSGLKAKRSLAKSRESLYSTLAKEPIKESKEDGTEDCSACRQCDSCCDNCCCSFWSWVLAFLAAIFGFIGGVVVGAVIQRNGVLRDMGVTLPGDGFYHDYNNPNYIGNGYRDKQEGPEYNNKFNSNGRTRIILPGEDPNDPNRVLIPGLHDANNNNRMYPNNRYPSPGPYGPAQYDPRCAFRFGHPMNHSYSSGSCTLCSTARLINVTGAGYADCNGLYTISNHTAIWDNKRIVYERVVGGWRPMDKRYIYWNAHYFGENFYGWSIGDSQSLVESGPFHSQGRVGASNQPWQGSWRANVSVKLVTCNPAVSDRGSIRLNPKNLDQLQKIRAREKEREMNMLRNMQYNRQNGDGGNY